ncbi:MAG: dipeptidyl aminopeptidase/acylaminoacyl peptidase, partial [Planctomycetota bacterium]
MNLRLFLCGALAALASTSAAQEAKRPLVIDDFFQLKYVGNPHLSPDGQWIAYTQTTSDLKKDKSETRIWMIPSAGGEALPMTAKGSSASSPRWSPDGKYLSFLSKRGDGKTQVWALNRLGGEAQELTKVVQGVGGYEWSPDSQRLLLQITDPKPYELTEDKKDDKKPRPHVIDRLQFKRDNTGYLDRYRTHLYVYTPGSEKNPIQITSGDFDDSSPVWSPDGKSIAFVSNRTEEPDGNPNSDIWVVSADNGDKGATLLQLTTNPREDSSPSWSPDGSAITYITVTAPLRTLWYATNRLATVPAAGGQPTLLAEGLDRNLSRPHFAADGASIYALLEDSGERQLVSLPAAGGKLTRHITGQVSVRDYTLKGSELAVLLHKPKIAGELFRFKDGQLAQLTRANQALLDQVELTTVENIHYPSGDGTEIEGFLYRPIGF